MRGAARSFQKDLQLITWWFTVHWRCWTYHVRTRACWAANVGNPHQEHLSEPTLCELMRWTASWHSQRGHHVSGSKGELDYNSIFSQGWSLISPRNSRSRLHTAFSNAWPDYRFAGIPMYSLATNVKRLSTSKDLVASGKRLHNYGKSPFLLGKSTIYL